MKFGDGFYQVLSGLFGAIPHRNRLSYAKFSPQFQKYILIPKLAAISSMPYECTSYSSPLYD